MDTGTIYFRPFTRDSLKAIKQRMVVEAIKKKEVAANIQEKHFDEKDYDGGRRPDSRLEQGKSLPIRMAASFKPEVSNIALEDFDPFYHNIPTFVIVTRKKFIFRFSATNALWLFSPFNPIRRAAIVVMTHKLFSIFIVSTIVSNWILMLMHTSPIIESTEYFITTIYTFEAVVEVTARGFILEKFTYLRDPWNWLDLVVILSGFLRIGINVGNQDVLKTFRLIHSSKTVEILPGLNTMVSAVIDSVKNLRDVMILTMLGMSVFSLIGLQIYMGVLTQKCIRNFPEDGSEGIDRDINWFNWNANITNWYPYPPPDEYGGSYYPVCGNSSGAGICPDNYTCLQGFGANPDYGYTSFDSFGWAFLSSFRLMTQDCWETMYQQILRAAGPSHLFFFVIVIFFGTYYLFNLILAIVAMSYNQLQKIADLNSMADIEEEKAMRDEETVRVSRIGAVLAEEAAGDEIGLNKSASVFGIPKDENIPTATGIYTEYSVFNAGQHSKQVERKFNAKGSISLPGSPYNGSHSHGRNKPIILPTCIHPENHFPHGKSYLSRNSCSCHCIDSDEIHHIGGFEYPVVKECQYLQPTKNLSRDIETSYKQFDARNSGIVKDMGNTKQSVENNVTYSRRKIHSVKAAVDVKGADVSLRKNITLDMINLNEIIEIVNGPGANWLSRDLELDGGLVERIKRIIVHGYLRCIDKCCVWKCGFPCNFLKKGIGLFVFDPFTELFITLVIVVNTIFMALDHHGLEENYILANTLRTGHKVFSSIFIVECAMKLMATSPKIYFKVKWNVFDFVIVVLSTMEAVFEDANLPGISGLRGFRLLRVSKLANRLLNILGKTMDALVNLIFILIILIFNFAVIGTQLFGKNYMDKMDIFPGRELPRFNFIDFGHSFMILFRVLCGEWIESMWDCFLVAGHICLPFFLTVVVIGNVFVLNLFLALLLSNFGATNLHSESDNDTNNLAEAFARIWRFTKWMNSKLRQFVVYVMGSKNMVATGLSQNPDRRRQNTQKSNETNADGTSTRKRPSLGVAVRKIMNSKRLMNNMRQLQDRQLEERRNNAETFSIQSYLPESNNPTNKEFYVGRDRDEDCITDLDDEEKIENEDEEWTDEEEYEETVEGEQPITFSSGEANANPVDCMPPSFYKKFPIFVVDGTRFGTAWTNIRQKCLNLTKTKYFEPVVIVIILLSSLILTLEDLHLPKNPVLANILFYLEIIFTLLFVLEMCIKWLALGLMTYFSDGWCCLDFVIGIFSIINFVAAMAGAGNVQAFKTIKILNALRPLRIVSRIQGMKIVVNALVQAIPSIFNVLLVCLMIWLIFAMMGIQLFSGKFHKCVDPYDGSIPDYRIIRNKVECRDKNFTWENSAMNFDHIGNAYLSLLQVATFKGWIEIMNDAVDSREIDDQPHRETNFVMYIYFVFFIMFGSFFTLNLFVSVIIDSFKEQNKKYGESMEMFMTEGQKKYYAAMTKMRGKKPIKAIPRPRWKPQAIVFGVVTNKKFEFIIKLFIGLTMLTMTQEEYQMNREREELLNRIHAIFIAIFTCECFLKIFALRRHYFTDPWNIFDLVVLLISIVGMLLSDWINVYFVSPTLVRLLRVAQLARVVHLVKGVKGIRSLVFALVKSLPALFNIFLLLCLVMVIFSILGMSLFKNVKLRGGLDEIYNFQTFRQSIVLLFQLSTMAGWSDILDGLRNEEDCNMPDPELGKSGDCGSTIAGISFLLAYLLISNLVVINMYIAVVIENYSHAAEELHEWLTDHDYDMFYEIWAQFDPDGTLYIRYDQLSEFFEALDPPIQIRKPNKHKIVSMDIPIYKGDMMYCVDILDALTKDFFARTGKAVHEATENDEVIVCTDRPSYELISSTLLRPREVFCAMIIQGAWRKYKSNPSRIQP